MMNEHQATVKNRFSGKTVLVTGASSGIGRETALAFARAGARVVLAARNEAQLTALVAAHPDLAPQLTVVPADVTSPGQVDHLFAFVREKLGRLDILVNNAGIGQRASVQDVKPEDAHRVMDVNFFGLLRCTQAAIPILSAQPPGPRGVRGQIVNVGSVLSVLATPQNSIYSASKFAVRAFSDALRIELRDAGIEVILIMPGYTDTPFFENQIRYGGPVRSTAWPGQHPSKVARAILNACEHHRREVALTIPGRFGIFLKKFFPRLLDRVLAYRSE